MTMPRTVLSISYIFALLAAATGGQIPMPPELLEAKSAFISSTGGDIRALDELAKQWRRSFPAVPLIATAADADIVLTLQAVSTGNVVAVPVGGLVFAGELSAYAFSIHTDILAPPLYTDREAIGSFSQYGGIRKLVERYQKRIASQR